MIRFTGEAWDQYLYWQTTDKNILKRINHLIKDCLRDPFVGLGKPEPLKRDLAGLEEEMGDVGAESSGDVVVGIGSDLMPLT
jgi:hypothetical protein